MGAAVLALDSLIRKGQFDSACAPNMPDTEAREIG